MERKNYYDTIVIGAGAGGLFFGAACPASADVLILEKTKKAGTKLLMSGSGQCNVTHGGSIKEFLSCYGANGKKIRSCLYKHNNIELRRFLSELGVESYEREDGKVFPVSMRADDVRNALLTACAKNGVEIRYGEAVTAVEVLDSECKPATENAEIDAGASPSCESLSRSVGMVFDGEANHATSDTPTDTSSGVSEGTPYTNFKGVPTDRLRYRLHTSSGAVWGGQLKPRFLLRTSSGAVWGCRHLVVACGGASYPSTGSDGELLKSLARDLPRLTVAPLHPALVPVFVENYPFAELSGISFHDVEIKIFSSGQSTAKSDSNAEADLDLSAENTKSISSQTQKSNTDKQKNNKKSTTALKLSNPVGDLLLTHKNFSGPVILNNSGYLQNGYGLEINFVFPYNNNDMLSRLKSDSVGNRKQISTYIAENFSLPRKLITAVLEMINICDKPMAQLSGKELSRIAEAFAKSRFTVAGTAGFRQAMATAGGISLDSVTLSDMQSKEYPGLYFIGEVLDINGDTGGYNLQFAYSSARSVIDGIYI